MSLLSLIAVLLLEQLRPLSYRRQIFAPLARWAGLVESRCNAGEHAHGTLAWSIAVGAPLVLALAMHALLYWMHPFLAWAWSVLILYLTIGFRQFSHFYAEIQFALRMGDEAHARSLLAAWCGEPCAALSAGEIARRSVEQALRESHTHVFAALLWFVLLPGPCGAVLYRVSAVLAEVWRDETRFDTFGAFARRAFELIDWVPARVTALGFAVVGNFEEALYRWRACARHDAGWVNAQTIVLASAAGALGIRLDPAQAGAPIAIAEAGVDTMQAAVGLVLRALLLWLILLLLLGVAGWLG